MRVVVLAAVATMLTMPATMAQLDPPPDFPIDVLVLIQTELDYLEVASQQISIDFKETLPERALEDIGKKARISIDVRGRLAKTPQLTASFTATPVKEILKWFAEETLVHYKVQWPDKLLVIVPSKGKSRPTR